MNSASVDEGLLAHVTSAFSRHNLDAIVASFAEDGQFTNARGAGPFGDQHCGRREIGRYFSQLFRDCPDLAYRPLELNLDLWQQGCAAMAPHGDDTSR